MTKPAKNTICLWYDRDAEDAARFYAKTFPDSSVGAVHAMMTMKKIDVPQSRRRAAVEVDQTDTSLRLSKSWAALSCIELVAHNRLT